MRPTLHWGNCHQEVPRRDSGAWGGVESRWGDRGNQCESRLGGQNPDQVRRLCDPGQLSNLSGPHSLIYEIGYRQFPPAQGSSPWLGATLASPPPHQARLAHRYTKFNATSQVWKPRGAGSHEVTGQNVKRCGVAQSARPQPAIPIARLTWTGRAQGLGLLLSLGLRCCSLRLWEADVCGLSLLSSLHVSEGTCRHSPREIVRLCSLMVCPGHSMESEAMRGQPSV